MSEPYTFCKGDVYAFIVPTGHVPYTVRVSGAPDEGGGLATHSNAWREAEYWGRHGHVIFYESPDQQTKFFILGERNNWLREIFPGEPLWEALDSGTYDGPRTHVIMNLPGDLGQAVRLAEVGVETDGLDLPVSGWF